jgi:hypothetical protein
VTFLPDALTQLLYIIYFWLKLSYSIYVKSDYYLKAIVVSSIIPQVVYVSLKGTSETTNQQPALITSPTN